MYYKKAITLKVVAFFNGGYMFIYEILLVLEDQPAPLGWWYECQAKNEEDAVEQARNEYPNCRIVQVERYADEEL